MSKPVKKEDLVEKYLSKEESDRIEQFYKDIGLGHYLTDPPPDPQPRPFYGNYGSQFVYWPLRQK